MARGSVRSTGDRLLAIASMLMVTIALAGVVSGETAASFTGTSTNPNNTLRTLLVQPPAAQNAAISAAAGVVSLSWTATPTVPGTGHTLTYVVLRGPAGGPYAQIGTTTSQSYSDTPPSDGLYEYVIQARVTGGGSFTSGNSAIQSGRSDRTAPVMSVLCNGAACGSGWYTASVVVVIGGSDAGTGMGSVTRSVDGGPQTSTPGSSATVTASGDGAGHSVAYFGTDAVGNASGTTTLPLKIDGTAPTTPGAFAAAMGAWGAPYTMSFTWTAATDATSGVASQTLRWVAAGTCPATATPASFPNTVSLAAGATSTTITNPAIGRICGYIQATDNAGNTSAPSAIKNSWAL